MPNTLDALFRKVRLGVSVRQAEEAIRANAAVTDAYAKNDGENGPLVMIAHDLEGGLY